MGDYTITVRLEDEPDEAEARVREALAAEGFGILTEIDVKTTMKNVNSCCVGAAYSAGNIWKVSLP